MLTELYKDLLKLFLFCLKSRVKKKGEANRERSSIHRITCQVPKGPRLVQAEARIEEFPLSLLCGMTGEKHVDHFSCFPRYIKKRCTGTYKHKKRCFTFSIIKKIQIGPTVKALAKTTMAVCQGRFSGSGV